MASPAIGVRQRRQATPFSDQHQYHSGDAKDAYRRVFHYLEPPLRSVSTQQTVERVGKPVEVQRAGENHTGGEGQRCGRQVWHGEPRCPIDSRNRAADPQAHSREPGDGPAGRAGGPLAARRRNDGEESDGSGDRAHEDGSVRPETAASSKVAIPA